MKCIDLDLARVLNNDANLAYVITPNHDANFYK